MQKLREPLRSFVNEVCAILGDTDIPTRQWIRVIRETQSSWRTEGEPRLNFEDALRTAHPTIQALPSFDRVVQIIQGDVDLTASMLVNREKGEPEEEDKQPYWIWWTFLRPFLERYLTQAQGPEFDDEIFDSTFEQVTSELEADEPILRLVSPLSRVQLSDEDIEFEPGLKLRSLSTSEQEKWINSPYFQMLVGGESRSVLLFSSSCIEVAGHSQLVESATLLNEAYKRRERLLLVLRLLTRSPVRTVYTAEEWRTTLSHKMLPPSGIDFPISSSSPLLLIDKVVVVGEAESAQLIDLWHRLRTSPNTSRATLALRQWNRGIMRHSRSDKLIDYWVALESLFSPSDRQEFSFRVPLRVASLIGETPDEREDIFKNLRTSYTLRSRIVHGASPEQEDMRAAVTNTESYLRRVLLNILESNEHFDPQKIERKILRDSAPPLD